MTSVELFVLSGFLGSGKTTLLVDFLKTEHAGTTGVIVNEAGEIGVDGAIVANDAGSPVTMMANGCVCCTLRDGLTDAVEALLTAPRPGPTAPLRRIIIETSGLSRPGPILAALAGPEIARWTPRAAVVTVYDAERGDTLGAQFEEAAAQFAGAQRIVASKVDAADAEALALHGRRAHALSPLADIIVHRDRQERAAAAFAPLTTGGAQPRRWAETAVADPGVRHPRLQVYTGAAVRPLTWAEWSDWLDNLAGACGDRLLRLKAVIVASDYAEPILVQGVGTTFDAPRLLAPSAAETPALLMVTRDLGLETLDAMLPDSPVRLRFSRW